MAYCLLADIEKHYMGTTFTASTVPTSTNINDMISVNSARIDGRLGKKYTTPITGTESLKIVKRICEILTASQVDDILQQLIPAKEKTDRPIEYRKEAEELLKGIEEGTLILSDAADITGDMFYNYNVENSITAVMKKDTRQW